MDEKMTQLEERIERLERRSQWLMLFAVGLGVIAVSIWKGGDLLRWNGPEAKAVPNIYAAGFALVDAEGRERAVLKLQDRGPVLGFIDTEGTLRLAVGLEDEQGSLTLYDADGRPRLGCTTIEKGAGISILGQDGKEVWSAP